MSTMVSSNQTTLDVSALDQGLYVIKANGINQGITIE